jgi:hypothetical protein
MLSNVRRISSRESGCVIADAASLIDLVDAAWRTRRAMTSPYGFRFRQVKFGYIGQERLTSSTTQATTINLGDRYEHRLLIAKKKEGRNTK